VIAIADNSRPSCSISQKNANTYLPKKDARKRPLNCRLKSRLNGLFWRKKPFKTVFSITVDTTSKKPKNRIRKIAIGVRMRLKIVCLPEQGNCPVPGFV
jgi:hypothetical protein